MFMLHQQDVKLVYVSKTLLDYGATETNSSRKFSENDFSYSFTKINKLPSTLSPSFPLCFSLYPPSPLLKAPDSTSGVISKTIDICLHKEGNSFGFVMRGSH